MNQHILLTGATGMLGKELIKSLLENGYQVSILSRKPAEIRNVQVFLWDVTKREIDKRCLQGVSTIIHLAGENIAKEKWTDKRKKEIIDSRVESARLLFDTLSSEPNQVKNFISAAAVGFYGNRGDEILREESPAGRDFMAECCSQWEEAADQFKQAGLRVVKIRTGVVLSKDDGALPQMSVPVKFFVGAPLGTGKQWIPWIHHSDMTQIYLHALKDQSIQGTYNACAPFPVTNKTLTKAIAKALHRPVWPFNVPVFVMKTILGEMSAVVLNSTNTSAQKLLDTGFIFSYTQLEDALSDIYGS
ncbi:TIGR01777 family oxidoreductase [Pedobacter sp. MC2016-15]|uniref:TIGR01777 family oxidoreductase n=1 Tax=Pedobacter sp. MC2016-15 TaxID=2994473 RepID=UPI0022473963|nr:TIGR01777 family oxidoreductase [Pedobacter sp. MC2016-15]MCX2481299.1 TIGR01777 family oxidoreductase [Pedobacter sp. MC2016-15]